MSEDWPLAQLRDEAEELRKKLATFRASRARFFVAKEEGIDLIQGRAGAGG